MMEYESLYLPILLKYKGKGKGKTLVRHLCRAKSMFGIIGNYVFSRTYHVERLWHDGKRYVQLYGGFHLIPEAEALKANKISVTKYVGKSELTVDLEYFKDNPLTHKFIREVLHNIESHEGD